MRTPAVFILLLSLFLGLSGPLAGKTLVNTGFWSDLALDGYDPVAFFTQSAAVKGKKSITTEHAGATYRFASTKHRDLFLENPDQYTPAFGGYCAWAVGEKNRLADVDIDTWQIVDGRLFLNYNEEIKARFNADLERLIQQADANWPGLVEAKGK